MDGNARLVLVELILILVVVFGFAAHQLAGLRRERTSRHVGGAADEPMAPLPVSRRPGRPSAR